MLPDSILLSSLFGLGISLLITALGYSFIRTDSGFGRFVASKSLLILTIITVLYIAWWWFYGVMRHQNFHTLIGDEGTFMNIFWNTLHGRPFATELWYGNFFSTHFEPSLVFIALLWAPWQSQIWLAGLQTIICAVGAFAAFGIARRMGLSPAMGLVFGLIWLFSISMRGIISVDFHGVIMVAAIIIWVPLLMLDRHYVWAMILAFILMNFKEDATVYLGGLGVIMALSFGEKRWGWIMAISAVAYYFIVHGFLWHAISPVHLDYFAARFPHLIQPDKTPLLAILSDPLQLIYPMLEWDRLWGLAAIFAPVLFLPLIRSGWVGLLPALWLLFTMALYSTHIFAGYYAGVIFNLMLIAAIPGFARLRQMHRLLPKPTAWLMLGFLAGSWFFIQPDESFSYINPSNLHPHPQADSVQLVVAATPADVSVSSDKFIGSFFSNRYVLRFFPDPEDRLGERIYITNTSICYPHAILAMGALGYRLFKSDPSCFFLSRGEGSDAGEAFMKKLRWTEAEGASMALWSTKPDRRASLGTAIHITPGCDYGNVVINTNKVFLPVGEYVYSLRARSCGKKPNYGKLPLEIRFVQPDGKEQILTYQMLVLGNSDAIPDGYEDMKIPFTVRELGLVYLRIDFGFKYDIWWDGIGLDGLDMTFDDYYHEVFPAEITPGNLLGKAAMIDLDGLKESDLLVELGELDREQIVLKWQPEITTAGMYWIYYDCDAWEDSEMNFNWADLEKVTDTPTGEVRQVLMPLVLDLRQGNHDIQLNHSPAPVLLAPGDWLEIKAYPSLPATIRLKGMWLMYPVVMNFLLYLD